MSDLHVVKADETQVDGLAVNAHLTIPRAELEFRASRSGGSGAVSYTHLTLPTIGLSRMT